MAKEESTKWKVSNRAIEAKAMLTSYRYQILNLTSLLFEGSILFLYILGLVVTVASVANGLGKLFS